MLFRSKTATVNLAAPLPARRYQFTVRSAVRDQAGNALGNGANYVVALEVGVPVLDPIGNRTVYDSAPLTFNAAANDPDRSGALTFSLAPGAPDGATITPGGRFTWTPADSFAGTSVQITIRVTDQNTPPLSDSETITISVLPNIAPVVQSFTVKIGRAHV